MQIHENHYFCCFNLRFSVCNQCMKNAKSVINESFYGCYCKYKQLFCSYCLNRFEHGNEILENNINNLLNYFLNNEQESLFLFFESLNFEIERKMNKDILTKNFIEENYSQSNKNLFMEIKCDFPSVNNKESIEELILKESLLQTREKEEELKKRKKNIIHFELIPELVYFFTLKNQNKQIESNQQIENINNIENENNQQIENRNNIENENNQQIENINNIEIENDQEKENENKKEKKKKNKQQLFFDLEKNSPFSRREEKDFIREEIQDRINKRKPNPPVLLNKIRYNEKHFSGIFVSNFKINGSSSCKSKHELLEDGFCQIKTKYPIKDVLTEMSIYHIHSIKNDEEIFSQRPIFCYPNLCENCFKYIFMRQNKQKDNSKIRHSMRRCLNFPFSK